MIGTQAQSNAAGITRSWAQISINAWESYKENYIFCGANCGNNLGLVFDPLANYHAVSEGVGYGMLLAVLHDDQETFDVVFSAAREVLRDSRTGLYHWRADNQGNIIGYGSATDADFDIAMALIFADQKVQAGEWADSILMDYRGSASELLDDIWTHAIVNGQYIKPGNNYSGGGREIVNLSYFSPAWFRLYDEFLGRIQWSQLIDTGYEMLYATDGASLGLTPDWSTADGEPAYEYCDEHDLGIEICRYEMRYDGIRALWRIGLDCIWFDDLRACEWMRRGAVFINSLGTNDFARMYNMQGGTVVDYEDEAMIGMWLFVAIAEEDTALQSRLEWDLYNFATQYGSVGFLSQRDSYYFNQSLALFSLTYLADRYVNVRRNVP